jgi:hypothetical protein
MRPAERVLGHEAQYIVHQKFRYSRYRGADGHNAIEYRAESADFVDHPLDREA